MCDKKNSVLFIDTKCIVLSSDFKLANENHVLLRVPRENNMYNVDLKNIVPSRDLTSLFAKATLDESNLWHKRLGHINFKTMNKLVKGIVTKHHNKTPYELLLGRIPSIGFMRPFGCHATILNTLDPLGKFDKKADEGFLVGYSVLLPLWSSGSKDPQNIDAATFDVKELESEVHDDKTKREAKGKSPVQFYKGVRDLSDDFEEFSDYNTNGVNAASTPVTADWQNSTNSTNTFSAADHLNTAITLEDIPYSDDEEDVGVEADFSSLETNITVSPILTTRGHKDHHVTQIIGDLSSAPQTRSITRMVKEQ
nr:ribonuclease H-like domain-containing protein [Tanacetum cinerariifolium]